MAVARSEVRVGHSATYVGEEARPEVGEDISDGDTSMAELRTRGILRVAIVSELMFQTMSATETGVTSIALRFMELRMRDRSY